MGMETAAAILTKLAMEQNTELKSKLNAVQGEATVVSLIMPLFRQIFSELEKNRQAHDKFPSATARPSPGRSAKAPPSDVKDVHAEEHRDDADDVGEG